MNLTSYKVHMPTEVFASSKDDPYMVAAIPQYSDFLNPKFQSLLDKIGHKHMYHRKLWEFAFIENRLSNAGMLQPNMKGLGFGVGRECLSSLFASYACSITATDAPPESNDQGWASTGQHASTLLDLHMPAILSFEDFNDRVRFETCDMNNIPPHLAEYDFCWSACSLEHLGSIRHGLRFIENSLATIKEGGWACHTTELNLSSDDDTVNDHNLCLFRRKDIQQVVDDLTNAGHLVQPINITLGNHFYDVHIDTPPYSSLHLKIEVGKFTTTSVGMMIQKGGRGINESSSRGSNPIVPELISSLRRRLGKLIQLI